jgi:hypothetical protein
MTSLRCDGLVIREDLLDSWERPVWRVNEGPSVCLL